MNGCDDGIQNAEACGLHSGLPSGSGWTTKRRQTWVKSSWHDSPRCGPCERAWMKSPRSEVDVCGLGRWSAREGNSNALPPAGDADVRLSGQFHAATPGADVRKD